MPEHATHHALSERFESFAQREARDSSPLYHALSLEIARDDQLLEIADHAQPGQPVPNLFFAAVHYLLGPEGSHPLAYYYSTRTTSFGAPSAAFPRFKDFAMEHRDEIIELLETRRVQTNEPRRSAYLYPALVFAASLFQPQRPLALVEIGASAGFNLLWDKYQYSYGDSIIYGDRDSPVLVTSEFRGMRKPRILDAPLPEISHRIGYDIHPMDTSDPQEVAWLDALVWPEHFERRVLHQAAIKHHRPELLDMRQGDGFAKASEIVDEVSEDSLLCLYHTHVANQIDDNTKTRFLDTLARVGKNRDLVHVRRDFEPQLHLTAYRDGKKLDTPLAHVSNHADWIDWFPEENIKSKVK